MQRLILATTLVVAASGAVLAQAPAADDPHHAPPVAVPAQPAAPAQPTPPAVEPSMAGMLMLNMGGAPMMGSGMAGIDHVEGRIAFLRTELKITETQTGAWNVFADALRSNAKKLGEMRSTMMPGAAPQPAATQQAPTMTERLDLQEKWLLAQLESTRTMKSAVAGLYGALSDDQKKTANDLLAPHMGMGMRSMMMGQMQPGQAPGGQMMQPGPMMRPGQMMQPPPAPPAGK
jgi:hypothetical protein